MSERMTGGEAIVRALAANGVEVVFGLPGAQTYPLFDALKRNENLIRTVTPRHEQATAYMALGYAKSTGRASAYTVVPGPGILNATAAICTAYGTNAPILGITGQVPAEFLGRGRGHLHELPDQLATLRTLNKWSDRIDSPAEAPGRVNEAFRRMLSGRQGPATLEMCWDAMAAAGPVGFVGPAVPDPLPPVDGDAVKAAAKVLAGAKRPMIMVGGGAQHAAAEVRALAEALGAPVTAFRSGRGIVSEDHPLGLSCAAAWRLWRETDVIVGIGSRMELQYMRWAGMGRLTARPEAPPHRR